MFTTDRQILERLLIPAMMSVVVVLSMREAMGEDGAMLDPVRELLATAIREAAAACARSPRASSPAATTRRRQWSR